MYENNKSCVYESHLKRKRKTQLNVIRGNHNGRETAENSMRTEKMTSEGSKINLYSPEAGSEIKQGAQ